jgi:hypothetical protein
VVVIGFLICPRIHMHTIKGVRHTRDNQHTCMCSYLWDKALDVQGLQGAHPGGVDSSLDRPLAPVHCICPPEPTKVSRHKDSGLDQANISLLDVSTLRRPT